MSQVSGFVIKEEERQSWISIALVWIGCLICVPSLMVGGMIGSGLPLGKCVIAIVIGYGIIIAYMSFIGMQGCDTGLPTAAMASGALGEKGSRYIISIILAIACIGWFGIQAGVCGTSFASMMEHITGKPIPVWASSLIWGLIMVLSACFRFAGLKWLNKIAVPLLLIVCAYTLISCLMNGGMEALRAHEPTQPMSMVTAISTTVATFALAGAISSDYCRFAKSRKDVVKSSVIGVLPAGLVMLLVGAILSIAVGTYDISVVLSTAGLPIIGLIALILATWTTNVANAYSGGLALANLLGQDEEKSRLTTGIAGIVGTVLAVVGILNSLQGFLSLLSAFVPALVGTLIADYWIIGKGKKEGFRIREGFFAPGIISFALGAFVACLTGGTFASIPGLGFLYVPFFVGPVNGIVVSMVVYILLCRFRKQPE